MFNPKEFWNNRFKELPNLQGVGNRSKSLEQNKVEYGRKAEIVQDILTRFDISPKDSIMEIGCGIGFWAKFLFDLGYKQYVGYDVSFQALRIATRDVPECTFVLSNINQIGDTEIQADVIICIDVLQHLVEEKEHDHALEILSQAKKYAIATTVDSNEVYSYYNVLRTFDNEKVGQLVYRQPFNDKSISVWKTDE